MPRPRIPISTHIAEGTFRKDRMGDRHEPEVGGKPVRPKSLTGEAQVHWDTVLKFIDPRVIGSLDVLALEKLCETWGLWKAVLDELKKMPADKVLRCAHTAYSAEWDRMAAKFGLTPQDRTKISTGGDSEKKPGAVAARSRSA
jgi:hypothetical protein